MEYPPAKRAAVIQDLSCVGRCALTMAIPVLSVMNVQPCPLPTAVLSANTAYQDIALCDLTDFMARAAAHWTSEAIAFDGVMSGYLSSTVQADIVLRVLRESKRQSAEAIALVDPAMADHGRLYRGMPADMHEAMRALCERADVITPNVTEAALLLRRPYKGDGYSEKELAQWLHALLEIGPQCAIITSVPLDDGSMANAYWQREASAPSLQRFHPIPASYHGTGDLFSAVLMGALLRDETMGEAIQRAGEFVYRAIDRTRKAGTPTREGVQFEALLPELWTGFC